MKINKRGSLQSASLALWGLAAVPVVTTDLPCKCVWRCRAVEAQRLAYYHEHTPAEYTRYIL